jgi:hypothetical protein
MDTNNEILDAIEILADKKIGDNITKVLTGICTSVNINKNTCVMDSNGVSGTVYFYGSPPEVNGLYRIFVPSNDMSRSFIIVPPKFTVNPNLLDNWYFGNPVNQMGGTEWLSSSSSAIPCVDRWTWWGQYITGTRLNLLDDGLQLAKPAEGQGLYQAIFQKVEKTRVPVGATVTLSALVKAEADASVVLAINDLYNVLSVQANVWELITFTVNAPSVEQTYSVSIQRNSGGIAFTVKAAKLELGSTQTLAHLENGNWVLNEIPKYEDVLSNCQRYAFNVVNSDDNWEILGSGFAMNENQLFCFIPTSTTLRGKPSIAYSGSFRAVRNTLVGVGIVINAMVVDHASNNGVSVVCTSATSFEVGEFYTLWCVPGEGTNSLIFSADL